MRWQTDGFHRIILALLLLVGLVLIVVPSLNEWVWDHGVLSELGKALVIAGILGFTIEPWLRKALARDVFSAAFGYHMPDDFKAEIARIANYKVICTKHIMDVRIRALESDKVRVRVTIERHFKNIGSAPTCHRAMIWIDEWGFPEKTEILDCTIFAKNGQSKRFTSIEKHSNLSVRAKSPMMLMLPDGEVSTRVEYELTKRRNDHHIEIFMSPTRRPEIRILEVPPALVAEADFGVDRPLSITHIEGRHELDGVYFPPAPMRVHWWPKTQDLSNQSE